MANAASTRAMFYGATSFSADLASWDVSNVTDMINMFWMTPSFTSDLSGWCVSLIPTEPDWFDDGSAMTAPPIWGTCPSS